MPATTRILALALLLTAGQAVAGVTIFKENFSGAAIPKRWSIVTGAWKAAPGEVSVETSGYDELLALNQYFYDTEPYTITVTLRGIRAGVFFSMDSATTKHLSQMVRFDEKNILTGYMNTAGDYTATNVFDVPKSPTDWTTLRIDVDPARHRYAIFVDGVHVGTDTNLVFTSGYFGLQGSEGLSAFKSVVMTADEPMSPPDRPHRGDIVTFNHISHVHTAGRTVTVYNPEIKMIEAMHLDGRFMTAVRYNTPLSIKKTVTWKGRTFAIEGRSVAIRRSSGALLKRITDGLVQPASLYVETRRAVPQGVIVADPGANALFRYDASGNQTGAYYAKALGGFIAPRSLDKTGKSDLVVADFNRVLFIPASLDETIPAVTILSPTSARIVWSGTSSAGARSSYAADGGEWKSAEGTSDNDKQEVTIEGLRPATRYSFTLAAPLKTLPPSNAPTRPFRFTTNPADSSTMLMTRLKIMFMVYRTISYRDVYPKSEYPQIPDGRTLTDDDLQYLKQACEFNRMFYMRNAACRVVLDFDFYVVSDTLWLHEVGDKDPYWLMPTARVTRDFEKAAANFGVKPESYDGLICPYAWVNYPPRRTSAMRDTSKAGRVNIRQAVGGATYGVPAPWKYGKTSGYTSNPFQDRFSRQDWLITHEFHHQIDALFDASGYPEYYHADMPWKMPGRFGEDFDFNAHIIRNANPIWWLHLKFGKLYETADADHDGVPDDDPSLPFDEKRLNGNPHLADTDGDGLNDLQEVMAGTAHGTALDNKDTDGDGLIDSVDPEPLYPISPNITPLRNDADITAHPFGTIKSDSLNAKLWFSWTNGALVFRYDSDTQADMLIQIDAENDGWFHGFDNYQTRICNTPDSVKAVDFYLRDCSSTIDPPHDRRDILSPSMVKVTTSTYIDSTTSKPGVKRYVLTAWIPKDPAHGLDLQPGKRFAIRLGLQKTWDMWVWSELFERNYMMSVTLRK